MKVLREPLFHFLILGAALFLVHAVASDVFSTAASRRIGITEAEIELIAAGFGRR